MAHEITTRADGFSEAAYALQPAWHGLGTVLDHAFTSVEAIKAAGLDWEVEQWELAAIAPLASQDNQNVSGFVANVRNDNSLVLGVVTDSYTPIQNRRAFTFLDGIVKDGILKYEACGSLQGGRKVWMLARMPEAKEIAKGDDTLPYILLLLSHDGTAAMRILPTAVRVVCMNTVKMALAAADDAKIMRIPHIGDVEKKLEVAQEVMGHARDRFGEYFRRACELARRQAKAEEVKAYVESVFPTPAGEEPSRQLVNTRKRIVELMDAPEQQIPSIRGTAWAAFNSVTQYIDHEKRPQGKTIEEKAERRFINVLDGPGTDIKEHAFDVARTQFLGETIGASN